MMQTIFKIPLWERDVILMLGGTATDIAEVAKKNKMCPLVHEEIIKDDAPNLQAAAYFCQDKGIGIMYFTKRKTSPGILAHEATHIVDWLLEFVGAETEMEARAYTVEWLVTNVPIFLKNLKEKTVLKKLK